jgi:hypothetical protein
VPGFGSIAGPPGAAVWGGADPGANVLGAGGGPFCVSTVPCATASPAPSAMLISHAVRMYAARPVPCRPLPCATAPPPSVLPRVTYSRPDPGSAMFRCCSGAWPARRGRPSQHGDVECSRPDAECHRVHGRQGRAGPPRARKHPQRRSDPHDRRDRCEPTNLRDKRARSVPMSRMRRAPSHGSASSIRRPGGRMTGLQNSA